MRVKLGVVLWAVAVFLFAFSTVGEARELTWQEVALELMSPACPGRTVLSCPSGEGDQLRTLVKQKVAEGWSKKQIIDYFVSIYGEEYRASPPAKGFYLLAWIVPFMAVGVGAVVVFLVMRVWRKKGKIADETESEGIPEGDISALSEKLDEELKKFDY